MSRERFDEVLAGMTSKPWHYAYEGSGMHSLYSEIAPIGSTDSREDTKGICLLRNLAPEFSALWEAVELLIRDCVTDNLRKKSRTKSPREHILHKAEKALDALNTRAAEVLAPDKEGE